MAPLTLEQIIESVPLLTEAERWQLLMEVSEAIPRPGAKKSIETYFGVLPPRSENPDAWVRRLRDEWDR
jgi:hypothetical protein